MRHELSGKAVFRHQLMQVISFVSFVFAVVKFQASASRFFLVLAAVVIALTGFAACSTTGAKGVSNASDASTRGDLNDAPTAKTLYAMSRMLNSQGKEDQAAEVLLKVLKQDSTFLPAYCDLARIQIRRGQVKDATQTVAKGLKLRPDDPVLLNDLGVCCLFQGQYQAALEHFTKASALAPEEKLYAANKALALGMGGKYDEALALYKQILPQEDAEHNIEIIRRGGIPGKAGAAVTVEATPPASPKPAEHRRRKAE